MHKYARSYFKTSIFDLLAMLMVQFFLHVSIYVHLEVVLAS